MARQLSRLFLVRILLQIFCSISVLEEPTSGCCFCASLFLAVRWHCHHRLISRKPVPARIRETAVCSLMLISSRSVPWIRICALQPKLWSATFIRITYLLCINTACVFFFLICRANQKDKSFLCTLFVTLASCNSRYICKFCNMREIAISFKICFLLQRRVRAWDTGKKHK